VAFGWARAHNGGGWIGHLFLRLGAGMTERSPLWTSTGGLFAIAVALLVLAGAISNMPTQGRYQFAPSALDGQVVWRGDTITGHAVLCATDRFEARSNADARSAGIVIKC